MKFNPLFISNIPGEGVSKPSKLANSNFIFSDIIKVLYTTTPFQYEESINKTEPQVIKEDEVKVLLKDISGEESNISFPNPTMQAAVPSMGISEIKENLKQFDPEGKPKIINKDENKISSDNRMIFPVVSNVVPPLYLTSDKMSSLAETDILSENNIQPAPKIQKTLQINNEVILKNVKEEITTKDIKSLELTFTEMTYLPISETTLNEVGPQNNLDEIVRKNIQSKNKLEYKVNNDKSIENISTYPVSKVSNKEHLLKSDIQEIFTASYENGAAQRELKNYKPLYIYLKDKEQKASKEFNSKIQEKWQPETVSNKIRITPPNEIQSIHLPEEFKKKSTKEFSLLKLHPASKQENDQNSYQDSPKPQAKVDKATERGDVQNINKSDIIPQKQFQNEDLSIKSVDEKEFYKQITRDDEPKYSESPSIKPSKEELQYPDKEVMSSEFAGKSGIKDSIHTEQEIISLKEISAQANTDKYEKNSNANSSSYKEVHLTKILPEIKTILAQAMRSQVMKIKVVPEGLGNLKIDITIKENCVNTTIEVENDSVKNMIQNNSNILKEALNQNGINLQSINVFLNGEQQKQKQHYTKKQKSRVIETDVKEKETSLRSIHNYSTYEYLA